MKKKLKESGRAVLRFFQEQHRRSTALMLVVCMMLTMLPKFAFPAKAAANNAYVSSSGSDTDAGTYSAPYATINKAYAAVGDGGTIYVMGDLTVSQQINFNANKMVVVRTTDVDRTGVAYTGGTAVVKRSATNLREPFTVTAGKVTFTNITLDGNTSGVENGKPAPWLDQQGLSFMAVSDTGTIVLDSGATVQNISAMGDTNEYVGASSRYGGINVSATLLIKDGSRITNIVAASGAIRLIPNAYATSVTCYVEMSGGVIDYCDSYNTTWQEGSAIYINQSGAANKANFKMTGGVIENCGQKFSGSNYGTIYLHPDNTAASSFIMTGGTIKNNKSGTVGGIYIASGNVQMSGDAQVFDNVDKDGNKANVLLKSTQTISLIGALSDKANIGISAEYMPSEGEADVPLALSGNGYTLQSADSRAFSSDKATTAGILLKDNQIVMSAAAKANEVTIGGKVSDYAGGKNTLSGITVSLYDAEDVTFSRPLSSGVTDANGNYTMNATAKPGNYVAHVDEKASCYNGSTSSSIAVSTSNVTEVNITLDKYSKSFVVLNKPVFTNDKSGYRFKSAAISNLTGVNSITFSITNGTTVQSVPTFLTPTSQLASINGDTRTFTYVFAGGVTVSQAEEFIRGIVFNYVAGANVSVTVDNNKTNLPDGAKITKFTPSGETSDHYYMYVNNKLTWNDAYNQAKGYRYMGMVGYLATITSQEEDTVLDNISMNGGWSGGSRYTDASDGATAPDINSTRDQYFRWSCGPEHGQNYYQYNDTSHKGPVNSAYNGFKDPAEPNNYGDKPMSLLSGNYEWCMQIHFSADGSSTKYTWNDLNATNTGGITGYFVEFSNYNGGMDTDYSDSKTATDSYSLATDGGVEEVATVTLNAPVYSSDHSVFSFDNAELTNISTIYSLTIKLDNYTNVLSKPSAPAVTNELTNIAGAKNTVIYQFGNGITLADAQSFLRGLHFRYGGLTDTSSTNVSITVDGNKTDLPEGASITEFNGHYYMYVSSDFISWTDAYNKAKSYTYMGLKGYLATITSPEEDNTLKNISTISAWSAGTRFLNNDNSTINDPDTVSSLTQKGTSYYWACGPESGTVYYNSITPTTAPGAGYTGYNGAYNNWGADPRQPDAYDGVEACMQINWPYDTGANGVMRWNDLPNDGLPNLDLVKGYFVEFSDYDGGRADGFTQSANGNSMVPISVKKGDVFSTVKNGGTYYVDTVLKAFDRNITNITVNNSAFTSGGKLPGNLNTTYTVKASDLSGNTATTTVTMKTIASISEPISGLTVNNVQMSDVSDILAAKATLTGIDTTDASADQKTEIANAIQNCKDLYFALFNATATPVNGTNNWYKNGVGDITLTAPDGFTVSTNPGGTWTDSISVDGTDGANKTAGYYLKETSTGDVSGQKTFSYKVDTTAPTGTISIENNAFKNFLSTISFGLFFKDSVDVTISGTDGLSQPVGISYQKVKDGETYLENGTWTDGSAFSVRANEKFSVYAKLTDGAGNVAIINSQGTVVYTDSTQNTTDISFTKKSTADISAAVNLNGNTIQSVKNGGAALISGTDYTVSDGTVTFKAGYLDSLAVGTYSLTVSYNPMGESYTAGTNNQAPADTALTLTIKGRDLSGGTGSDAAADVAINPGSMVYSGSAFTPDVTVKDGSTVLTEGTDYTLGWTADMTNVGEKTLTVAFRGSYKGSVTKKAAVTNAAMTDTTVKTQSAVFNNSSRTITAPSATVVNAQPVTVKYSEDGGLTYPLTSAPQYTHAGSYDVFYQLSAPNHDAATGKITFTVNAATDNTVSTPVLNGWVFGGTANTPSATAKYGTPVFTYSNSENGTYTSTAPTNAGTWFVKAAVASSDDYNGSEATASFTISAKPIDSSEIALSGINDDYLFTGSAITPEPTVTANSTVLKKDTDYTVTYENNTDTGTAAKVKVTLKGNYSGTAEKTFEIRYGTIDDNDIKNVITLPDFNSQGWHNQDIVVAAVGDWTLCTDPTGTFGKELTISNESTPTGTDCTFYIKAVDGSVYERTLNYKLDKTAPEGSVDVSRSGLKNFLRTISFGLLFNSDADVTVNSNDDLSGIANVQVYRADRELTEAELADVPWSNYTDVIHETAKDEGHFVYYARITDNAGNTVVVNSEGVTFDTTPPVISGVTNGGTYYTTQKFLVTDANVDTVMVNGKKLAVGNILFGNVNETYTIVAADKAGNTTTYMLTMKPLSNLSDPLNNIPGGRKDPDDKKKIEDIRKKAEDVDITNATEEEKEARQKIIDQCDRMLKEYSGSPQTGDSGNLPLWITLFLASGGLLAALCVRKKRKDSEEK